MNSNTSEIRNLRSSSVGTEVGEYKYTCSDLIMKLRLASKLSSRKQAILSRFINDMERAIAEVSRVLAPGGKAIYVIGENTVKGTYIKNAKIIIALARRVGLRLECQTRRTLPPNRRYLPPAARGQRTATLDRRMRREVILHFIKSAR